SAKRVVQVAAVLGRQFRARQLAALLADDGVDVQRDLEELERRGLVHRKTALSSDEFRFGESLTQEVAYEGLLLKQRRQLHERIAALIEAEPTERGLEHAALLAHHYARETITARPCGRSSPRATRQVRFRRIASPPSTSGRRGSSRRASSASAPTTPTIARRWRRRTASRASWSTSESPRSKSPSAPRFAAASWPSSWVTASGSRRSPTCTAS